MRIVFMGTPEFSVAALKALIEAGHEVIAVLTQPDRPKGRGKQVQFSPVKEEALLHDIPVYQPVHIKKEPECIELLRNLQPDAMVVVAFGQLLPKEVLDIPKYGCINIHASLLPMYRGAAPIQRVILNGETKTGVTTMLMDEGLDTGDMLETEEAAIDADETGGSLHDKLSEIGGRLILSTLDKLEKGTLVPKKQEGGTCYASMLKKEEGLLDFTKPAEILERQIRGLNPWPSAYTSFRGKTLKLWKAQVVSPKEDDNQLKNGQLILENKDILEVKTGAGRLRLLEIQMEGKKRMPVDAFLHGYNVEEGEMLGEE